MAECLKRRGGGWIFRNWGAKGHKNGGRPCRRRRALRRSWRRGWCDRPDWPRRWTTGPIAAAAALRWCCWPWRCSGFLSPFDFLPFRWRRLLFPFPLFVSFTEQKGFVFTFPTRWSGDTGFPVPMQLSRFYFPSYQLLFSWCVNRWPSLNFPMLQCVQPIHPISVHLWRAVHFLFYKFC